MIAGGCQRRNREETAALRRHVRERESRLETLHAELQTLQGALTQARADRTLKREDEISALRRGPEGAAGGNHAALRQEIMEVAGRLMIAAPKQEAAE
jgi:hypothetical protein